MPKRKIVVTNNKARPTKTSHQAAHRLHWQTIAGLVLAAGFFYIVLPRLSTFRESFSLLGHARLFWVEAAFVAALTTYAAAAGIYCLLAKHRLRYGSTLLVQMAGMFVNRILPGGVGALSVSFEYLRKHDHTAAEAGSVIAVNNVLGVFGNGLLFLGAILIVPTHLHGFSVPHLRLLYVGVGAILIILAAVLLWSRKLRSSLYSTLLGIQRNIVNYRAHPLRLVSALGVSLTLTLCYTWCLAACARAIGIHLDVAQVLVIMTAGVTVGTLTPTPGGLFGAEAGLFAGFVAYGVKHNDALAIVLLYRLLTYWLALLLGGISLLVAERRGYL
jgi:uncharacterized membrane protein YbhN (UPF0104 family)